LKEKIRIVIELQACDNRIREIIRKKDQGPLRIQRLKDELGAVEGQIQRNQDKIEALKKERRKYERDVQDLDGKVEKSALKLSNVKSNKEYTAALKEIDDLKNLKFSTEDRVLQFMEEIEELEEQVVVLRRERMETEDTVRKGIAAIEEEVRSLDGELQELERLRTQLTQSIDRDLLKTYLLLKERKGGLAIGAVIRGVCQTCHLGFPPQNFNEIIKCDSVHTCPNCNRIVYWGEDEAFQLDPKQSTQKTIE
jgi:predicted  nucleic acid-binding Zn-ribbon protein